MSKLSKLAHEIERMLEDDMHPQYIAGILGVSVVLVYDIMEKFDLETGCWGDSTDPVFDIKEN